ncbi:MAG: hypothetical protein RSD62_00410 [Ruthenibacterium sp.]
MKQKSLSAPCPKSAARLRKTALLCLPFLVLAVYFIVWHTNGDLTMGDDPFFSASLGWLSLPEWLVLRWNTWTSRQLLDLPLVLMARSAHAQLLWGAVSTLCLLAIAFCLTRLCSKQTPLTCALACLMTGLIWTSAPFDCGMLTLSAIYLWPLAATAFCLLPLRTARSLRWYQWLLCLPCLVYAANNEQLCVALFLLFASAAALRFFGDAAHRAGPCIYPLCGMAICSVMLAIHLLCPGNAARRIANYEWFVDYDMLTLPQKLELGASGTVSGMLLTPSLAWGLFYLVLAAVCILRCRGLLFRILGCAPAALWLFFGVLPNFLPEPLRSILTIGTRLTQQGSIYLENHSVPTAYLFPALMLTFAFLLLAAVYVALGHTLRALAALLILLIGFSSRMTLIFSPSVWASGLRTHLVLQFCCAAVGMLLVDSLPALRAHRNTPSRADAPRDSAQKR